MESETWNEVREKESATLTNATAYNRVSRNVILQRRLTQHLSTTREEKIQKTRVSCTIQAILKRPAFSTNLAKDILSMLPYFVHCPIFHHRVHLRIGVSLAVLPNKYHLFLSKFVICSSP
jgi:hypothetical protein